MGDDRKLTQLAGEVKNIQACFELAECYSKQLGITTEAFEFKERAVEYMSLIYAHLQAMELMYEKF